MAGPIVDDGLDETNEEEKLRDESRKGADINTIQIAEALRDL